MEKFTSIVKIKKPANTRVDVLEVDVEDEEPDVALEYEESISDAVMSTNGDLWFEKYRPKTLEDIVVTDAKLQAIREWFRDFEAHTVDKKALVFTGPPGTGKTSLAHIALREFGYSVKEFNASDIRSQSQVNESMYDLVCVSNVTRSQIPIGIVMDEVDGMLTGDRGGIDELLSFIQAPPKKKRGVKAAAATEERAGIKKRTNVWGPPIICICNTGNAKQNTLTELRKHCLEINFMKPTSGEMSRAMDRVMTSEHLKIAPDAKDDIIKYSQGDYRRLMCLLQHLHSRHGRTITRENVIASYHIFCQKEQDLHVKDNIKRILNKQYDFNTVLGVYYRDKSKTPMVMHQNYIKAIDAQKTTSFEKIENAIRVIDSLVDSDITEKTMYNTQGWHLQPIQGLTCCYIPSHYINKYDKTRTIEANWTEVLGTSSHTQSSKKKIHEIMSMINKKNSYNNSDIQFLSDMVLFLVLNNREKEAVSMLSSYNLLEPKIIDKLSSIVKLNAYSEMWKDKTAGEKNKVEQLREAALKLVTNDVVELGTKKMDPILSSHKTVLSVKPKITAAHAASAHAPAPTVITKGPTISIVPKNKPQVANAPTTVPAPAPIPTPIHVPAKQQISIASKKDPKRTLVLVKKCS